MAISCNTRHVQGTGSCLWHKCTWGLVVALVALQASCGGDVTEDDEPVVVVGDDAGNHSTSSDSVSVNLEYPFFVGTSEEFVFPTYLAHLIGTEIAGEARHLVCFTLTNTGQDTRRMELEVALQGYSVPARKLLELAPNESASDCISPDFELDKLYALSSRSRGTIATSVTDADSGVLLAELSRSTPITSPNTVIFRTAEDEILWPTVAVRVAPEVQAIREVYRNIQAYSFKGNFGTGGYRAGTNNVPWSETSTLDLRTNGADAFSVGLLSSGESLSVNVQSLQGGGASMHLLTEDAFSRWLDGDQVQTATTIDSVAAGQTYPVTAASAAQYYLLFQAHQTGQEPILEVRHTLSQVQDVLDYLQATFRYLHDQGLEYVHVPQTFFDGAQSVQSPEAALAIAGANCIDGAVIFASVLEAAGIDPLIAIVPGHAFVGAWTRPRESGESLPIFIETTMVSEGNVQEAFARGMQQFYQDVEGNAQNLIDIYALREVGFTPMPF